MQAIYWTGLAYFGVFLLVAIGLYLFGRKYGQPPPYYTSYLVALVVLGVTFYLSSNQIVHSPSLYPGISEEMGQILQNHADGMNRLFRGVIFALLFIGVWLFDHGYQEAKRMRDGV